MGDCPVVDDQDGGPADDCREDDCREDDCREDADQDGRFPVALLADHHLVFDLVDVVPVDGSRVVFERGPSPVV